MNMLISTYKRKIRWCWRQGYIDMYNCRWYWCKLGRLHSDEENYRPHSAPCTHQYLCRQVCRRDSFRLNRTLTGTRLPIEPIALGAVTSEWPDQICAGTIATSCVVQDAFIDIYRWSKQLSDIKHRQWEVYLRKCYYWVRYSLLNMLHCNNTTVMHWVVRPHLVQYNSNHLQSWLYRRCRSCKHCTRLHTELLKSFARVTRFVISSRHIPSYCGGHWHWARL